MSHHLPHRRGATAPVAALALTAGLLLPVAASASPPEPTALLAGELVLVADTHRTDEPSPRADEMEAALRLPSGLTVPLEASLVGVGAPGSRLVLEVPGPPAVVDAVEAGEPVTVVDAGAAGAPTGAPATEEVLVPAAALEAARSRPARAASDLGVAAAVALAAADEEVATATVVSAAAPAPVAATGAPKQVTAVVVDLLGRTDTRYTDAEVSRLVGAGSDFWADQSGGATTFVQQGATVRYASSLTCSSPFALWDEAAARSGFVAGPDRYLVLLLPRGSSGCSYGLGTVGSGPGAGGYSYVADASWPALAHEWGHNMSLLHADRAVCGAVADATSCTEQAYGDLPDVMSSTSTPAAAGNASAMALGRLGMLPPEDRVTVTATGVSTVELAPLSDHAGVRSAAVVDPRSGRTYHLEVRQDAGRDTYGWAGRAGQTFGLRVMRSGTGRKTLVLDASPTSGGTDPDVVVKPGTTFVSAGGGMELRTRLEASGAVTASVSLAPTGATHWLTGPFATAVVPAALPRTAVVDVPVVLTGRVTGPAGRSLAGRLGVSSPAGGSASTTVAADGTFSLPWTPTVLGRAAVTLAYEPGSTDHLASTTALVLPVVAPTAVSATSPAGTTASGAAVSLPVAVSAPAHPGVVPAGTVTVSEGTRTLASAVLSGGRATVRLPVLVGGPHALGVAFTPASPATGPTTAPSTTTASVTVAPAPATATATLPLADVATTETGRVAVTVAASGVVPTGTVTVLEGGTALATGTLVGGRASVVLPRLPVGYHDLVAAYGGEVRALAARSAPVRLEVTRLPRSRVTATVATTTTAVAPAVVVRATSSLGPATGPVTVTRAGAVVGTGTLVGGAATVRLRLQPAGTAALAVQHAGGDGVEGGSTSASLVVTRARPTVTTTLSTATKRVAETATVRAVVASPAGTPAGSVTLRSGTAVLARATLSGGSATLTVPTTLPVGTRSLVVAYGGSTELLPATSAARTLTVTP